MPLQDGDGEAGERHEALLSGEKQLLEMVASGAGLRPILGAICRLVEEMARGCHCSILLVDAGGTALEHAAAPTLPADVVQEIDGKDISRPYWGPCAMALEERSQILVPDIREDSRWRGRAWNDVASRHGLVSCWTTPILARAGDALGTFAIYRREIGHPSDAEQELTARFSHIASIAIEHERTAKALRESERELRLSQVYLSEAQRLSSTGSFSWRVAAHEIVWSEQTYRIYELDPGVPATFELVGTRIHPDEREWFQELLERAARDGRDLEFEHRLFMPDGSTKYLHVVAHATRDGAGELEYVGAVQDVTERRRAEAALGKVRAELAHIARVTTLGALAAAIAHEVSQPLAGISTNAQISLRLLSDDPPNVDVARETARDTIRDANRATEVVLRLRALFEKATSTREAFDLNRATLDVLALFSSELERARVVVQAVLADDLPALFGDRVQLQQVVMNLVLNAVEAMNAAEDRRRELVVRTEVEPPDHVRLSVRDSGPGFARHDALRLFDMFHTTKNTGMGVGLYVCRSIVEHHDGRIWAENNDGTGATFTISLPWLAAPHRLDDPPPEAHG